MLRRSRAIFDFRSTPKLADEFSASISRQSSKYDHVLIDVGPFASIGTRVVKGLTGVDRDLETTTFIQRQIFGVVMRKYAAAKSIGLFFDGSDPLWKSHRSRKYPSKKFDDRFYRSCASPMAFMCEEKLRTALADTARGRVIPEFTISGPATAGPVEAKMSAYLNDLAARFVDPNGVAFASTNAAAGDASTSSQAATGFAQVQPTDSILIVGMDEAFLTALGALPFSNITTVLMDGRDLKSLTMAEGVEWMAMGALGKPATAQPGASLTLQQQKARVDALILYILANGCSATDLNNSAGLNFSDLMAAYFDSQQAAAGNPAGNYLCDLTAPLSSSSVAPPSESKKVTVGIDLTKLERVLSKASRKMAGSPKEDSAAADYLEVLMQTVAMFVDGGIKNYGFVPTSSLLESPPPMKIEQLLGHIKFLNSNGLPASKAAFVNSVVTGSSSSSNGGGGKVIVPSEGDRDFALTVAEQLLLAATLPSNKSIASVTYETPTSEVPTVSGVAAIKAIHPSMLGGFELPEKALNAVVHTEDIKEAASVARDVLSYLDPNDTEHGYHPALRHTPSYYFYNTKTVGPPAGYEYLPVNLGQRSEEQQTRAAFLSKAVAL